MHCDLTSHSERTKPQKRSIPIEYDHYRNLMLKVLGQLARQGYRFAPDEGIDLIHEFFANQWELVERNYDSEKGKFTSYLAKAFYYDARRRLVKMASWRSRLVDGTDMAELVSDQADPAYAVERTESLQQIHDALLTLDDLHRDVLEAWLSARVTSERELSCQIGASRYRTREILINALGQVALRFRDEMNLGDLESQVARCLWYEGRSPRNVAVHLGVTSNDIHAIRRRIAGQLHDAIRYSHQARLSLTGEAWRTNMSEEKLLKQLKDIFLSPNDEEKLSLVRRMPKAFRHALEADNESVDFEFSQEEIDVLNEDREWPARVYEAIAEADHADEECDLSKEVLQAIDDALKSEDQEIGRAFTEGLLATMPPEKAEWELWFGEVPQVTDDVLNQILEEGTTKAGTPQSEGLARFGLTPGIIFEACEGISMLLDRIQETASNPALYPKQTKYNAAYINLLRWVRQQQENREDIKFDLAIDFADVAEDDRPIVPTSLVLAEIGNTPDCPPKAAEPLLKWFFQVIPFTPLLFPNYAAEQKGDDYIQLKHDLMSGSECDLYRRWSLQFDHC